MYGATALAGGKGGIQCAQHIFEKDDIISFLRDNIGCCIKLRKLFN